MERVVRPPGLTPSELLPEHGRVATQASEIERLRQAYDQLERQSEEEFSSQGWSGNFYNYNLGDEALRLEKDGSWTYMAKRNDEISLKDLNQKERELFEESDKIEWKAILETGAVRVVTRHQKPPSSGPNSQTASSAPEW